VIWKKNIAWGGKSREKTKKKMEERMSKKAQVVTRQRRKSPKKEKSERGPQGKDRKGRKKNIKKKDVRREGGSPRNCVPIARKVGRGEVRGKIIKQMCGNQRGGGGSPSTLAIREGLVGKSHPGVIKRNLKGSSATREKGNKSFTTNRVKSENTGDLGGENLE